MCGPPCAGAHGRGAPGGNAISPRILSAMLPRVSSPADDPALAEARSLRGARVIAIGPQRLRVGLRGGPREAPQPALEPQQRGGGGQVPAEPQQRAPQLGQLELASSPGSRWRRRRTRAWNTSAPPASGRARSSRSAGTSQPFLRRQTQGLLRCPSRAPQPRPGASLRPRRPPPRSWRERSTATAPASARGSDRTAPSRSPGTRPRPRSARRGRAPGTRRCPC